MVGQQRMVRVGSKLEGPFLGNVGGRLRCRNTEKRLGGLATPMMQEKCFLLEFRVVDLRAICGPEIGDSCQSNLAAWAGISNLDLRFAIFFDRGTGTITIKKVAGSKRKTIQLS